MIVILCFAVLQFATAAVIQKEDPMIIAIDDIEGLLYEVPDYEDPEMIQHQLSSSFGSMPIFSLMDMARKQGDFKGEEFYPKQKIAESTKTIDDVIYQLDAAKSKLEKGIGNIYTDIEKSLQNLKKLERSFRPDVLQVISSLRSSMSFVEPLVMPFISEMLATKSPVSYNKQPVFETPEMHDTRALDIRVISGMQSTDEDKPIFVKPLVDVKEISDEKLYEGEKPTFGKSLEDASGEMSTESEESVIEKPKHAETIVNNKYYETQKYPFQMDPLKKRYKKVDDDDLMSSYQSKYSSWKADETV